VSVANGQAANAAIFNAAFVSKTTDSTMTSILSLNHGASAPAVANVQSKLNSLQTEVDAVEVDLATNYIPLAQKAAPNGVASLDALGKVPITQIPDAIIGALNYQGTWNASTNTPTLADGTGVKGYYYVITVAGSQNLGSGSISFDAGDWVVHNGTIWEKLDAENVQSVNGQTGVVVVPTLKVEYRTITSGEETAKSLTLAQTPFAPTEVALDVKGGVAQFYTDDFTVSGTTLSWLGLGLDGILVDGDKVRIMYSY